MNQTSERYCTRTRPASPRTSCTCDRDRECDCRCLARRESSRTVGVARFPGASPGLHARWRASDQISTRAGARVHREQERAGVPVTNLAYSLTRDGVSGPGVYALDQSGGSGGPNSAFLTQRAPTKLWTTCPSSGLGADTRYQGTLTITDWSAAHRAGSFQFSGTPACTNPQANKLYATAHVSGTFDVRK